MIEIGMKFGYLTVIDRREHGEKRKSWLCECSCGNKLVVGQTLLLGSTDNNSAKKSCGCEANKYHGKVAENLRLYNIWYEMNKRCHNPKADNYERYGGSGVTVVDEWQKDFTPFLEWSLANGYTDNLTIDRIDSSKGYSPENCRWADYYMQMQNRGLMGNNKTGVNGVAFSEKHGYRAYITRDKIRKELGSFESLDEAQNARMVAEEHYKKHGTIKDL